MVSAKASDLCMGQEGFKYCWRYIYTHRSLNGRRSLTGVGKLGAKQEEENQHSLTSLLKLEFRDEVKENAH